MNKGVCNHASNNKYFNCPPRMNDGRQFTDYRPNCYVNNLIRMTNSIPGSYEYRQFLINNAEDLMQVNREYIQEKSGCHPCNAKPVPLHRECDVNLVNMNCKVVNPHGVGTAYQSGLH